MPSSAAKFGYLFSVERHGTLKQLFAVGADNRIHAVTLVNAYFGKLSAQIIFENELDRQDINRLKLKRGQVVPFV